MPTKRALMAAARKYDASVVHGEKEALKVSINPPAVGHGRPRALDLFAGKRLQAGEKEEVTGDGGWGRGKTEPRDPLRQTPILTCTIFEKGTTHGIRPVVYQPMVILTTRLP
jgi:hypothetical protein